MTLEKFLKLNQSNTKIYKLDDKEVWKEFKLDENTKSFLYDVVGIFAISDNLIGVYIT